MYIPGGGVALSQTRRALSLSARRHASRRRCLRKSSNIFLGRDIVAINGLGVLGTTRARPRPGGSGRVAKVELRSEPRNWVASQRTCRAADGPTAPSGLRPPALHPYQATDHSIFLFALPPSRFPRDGRPAGRQGSLVA